jgi:chemotaxis signal transduction protein
MSETILDRFAAIRRVLQQASGSSEANGSALLLERARALAKPPPASAEPVGSLDAVVFALGHQRCAIGMELVREAIKLASFCRVPGVPPHIAGITHLRGEILAVLDLRVLLQAPIEGIESASFALVLGRAEPELAILVDEIEGTRRMMEQTLRPRRGSGADSSPRSAHVLGLSPDGIVVLDAAALVDDPSLWSSKGQPT